MASSSLKHPLAWYVISLVCWCAATLADVNPDVACLDPVLTHRRFLWLRTEEGCNSIVIRSRCLQSRDGRNLTHLYGLHIKDEPCVWCGGSPCTSTGSALCEPRDFLNGKGVAFARYLFQTYSIAWCPRPLHPEVACLEPYPDGCHKILDEATCSRSRDGRSTPYYLFSDIKIKDQPCVWCGGGPCTSPGGNLCESMDYLTHGGSIGAFLHAAAPENRTVASCRERLPTPTPTTATALPTPTPTSVPTAVPLPMPTPVPTGVLTEEPAPNQHPTSWPDPMTAELNPEVACLNPVRNETGAGCNSVVNRSTCLQSRDGRNVTRLYGYRIKDEPCVWCGGGPCTGNGTALCEPRDFLNGRGVAFERFSKSNECETAWCPRPLSPEVACLEPYSAGCHEILDQATCLISRDGRSSPYYVFSDILIKDQPCVWCGGGQCTSPSGNLCEPMDFLKRGASIGAFTNVTPLNNRTVASCRGGIPYPTLTELFNRPSFRKLGMIAFGFFLVMCSIWACTQLAHKSCFSTITSDMEDTSGRSTSSMPGQSANTDSVPLLDTDDTLVSTREVQGP